MFLRFIILIRFVRSNCKSRCINSSFQDV